ncbi:MAG TPA: DUF6526 family protein [Thermoanaerobaculia bacterium]|jgi:hypothetical protein|nr:DUF6526 family protein [Thermoanaerobaculia bacterium]
MSETGPQTYANHARWDPAYHFFAGGVLLVNVLVHLFWVFRAPGFPTVWGLLVAASLVVVLLKLRVYPLKAQDRVIRLEERIRLNSLAGEPLRARLGELTVRQLVALRFASDDEVTSLAQQAIDEKLSEADIKKRIKLWRPDTYRV